jgi:hypothetical protein
MPRSIPVLADMNLGRSLAAQGDLSGIGLVNPSLICSLILQILNELCMSDLCIDKQTEAQVWPRPHSYTEELQPVSQTLDRALTKVTMSRPHSHQVHVLIQRQQSTCKARTLEVATERACWSQRTS